jgi:hypothetical protein
MVLPRRRFYGRILSPKQATTHLAANLTRDEDSVERADALDIFADIDVI